MKIIGISIMIFLVSATGVFAQNEASMRKHRPDREHRSGKEQGMREKQSHIPNLTDQQKEQLKVARTKLQKESLPLKNELREKKARLKTLTSTDGSSEKDISKVIDEIGALQTKMMKVRVAHQLEIKKFLTEEQRLFLDSRDSKKRHGRKMRG